MKELNVEELRAFLAGDDTHLMSNAMTWGYLDGKVLFDPPRWRNRSEIVEGRLVVMSRHGQLADFILTDLSCVAPVPLTKPWQGTTTEHVWLVDAKGIPIAEVPWGGTVEQQAREAGVAVRRTALVGKKAFKALRPERRLG